MAPGEVAATTSPYNLAKNNLNALRILCVPIAVKEQVWGGYFPPDLLLILEELTSLRSPEPDE